MEEMKKLESSREPEGNLDVSRKIKILYVEDEDVNWEVTMLNLRSRYSVTRARNSEEAITLLKTKSFHAVLMDVQLSNSDLDGIGITALIRGTAKSIPAYARDFKPSPELPVIFLTAYAARYSREDMIERGGDELVTKPVDFTRLGLCLSRCLLKKMQK